MHVSQEHKEKTREYIRSGQTFEAIKYLRDQLQLDQKTAFKLVLALRKSMEQEGEQVPESAISRSSDKATKIIPAIFIVIGLGFLGLAFYFYSSDLEITSQNIKVIGKVIASPSNPLFEYEYNGEVYQHQSSTTSDPPSYDMGEEVTIYVNGDNPYDIVVDTFTDRWLVVVIFGAMGIMFTGVSSLVFFVFRAAS